MGLSDEVKKLEESYQQLGQENFKLQIDVRILKDELKIYRNCCEMLIPVKIYSHKQRRNTTVKFKDGSSVTVKRKQGEKDCTETAIAYAVLKQLLPKKELEQLIKEREEH